MFLGHFIKNACYLLFPKIVDNHACEGAAEDGGDLHEAAAGGAGLRLLRRIDALHFFVRMKTYFLHPCADSLSERVTFDVHQFAGSDLRGV